MGSHWKGVKALGTKGLTWTVIDPIKPFGAPCFDHNVVNVFHHDQDILEVFPLFFIKPDHEIEFQVKRLYGKDGFKLLIDCLIRQGLPDKLPQPFTALPRFRR